MLAYIQYYSMCVMNRYWLHSYIISSISIVYIYNFLKFKSRLCIQKTLLPRTLFRHFDIIKVYSKVRKFHLVSQLMLTFGLHCLQILQLQIVSQFCLWLLTGMPAVLATISASIGK